jgi:phosphoribosylformylglycinamidine synthase PurS subunit
VKARVLVYPRREVLDPQAKAIHQALERLGFDDVVEVHAGKAFELELASGGDAEARLRAMCEKLLANPIMERFSVELLASGNGDGQRAKAGESKPAKAPAKKPTPVAAEGPTAGTAGGQPVPAESPGTTAKNISGTKKGAKKGSQP